MDSAIHRLNNWGLLFTRTRCFFWIFEAATINRTGDLDESKECCMVSAPNINSNLIVSPSVQVPSAFLALSPPFCQSGIEE